MILKKASDKCFDFLCPSCSGYLEDSYDYDLDNNPNEDFENHSCPHCASKIKVKAQIIWEYIALGEEK